MTTIDPEIKARALGAVLGQAIGDAIGHPVEFEKTYQVVGLDTPNQFTDDTQMFCALGEALLDAPPHQAECESVFMEALSKRFVEWRKNPLGGNHRAPGGTCMEGVRKLGAKRPWTESGALHGKGNGTAMRSGVVGVMYWQNPDYAFRIGALQSVNTHNNLEAILGAAVVSYLVAASIQGIRLPIAVSNALMLCSRFNETSVVPTFPAIVPLDDSRDGQSPWRAIAKFGSAFALGRGDISPKAFAEFNGDDFSVVPAVSAAIFYNSRFFNYSDIVLNAANYGDDADTVAAISGTIAGALRGVSLINQDWRDRVELSPYLNILAERLWQVSLSVGLSVDTQSSEEMQSVDALLDSGEVEF